MVLTCKTFEERLAYLQLDGVVGRETFGYGRYLNQRFYASKEWKDFRREIILRDNGCDLGIQDDDYIIQGRIIIHHINPIRLDDLKSTDIPKSLMDPNNSICVSHDTHESIHYGCEPRQVIFKERYENDTVPWR